MTVSTLHHGYCVFANAFSKAASSDLAFDILSCGACILFPRCVISAEHGPKLHRPIPLSLVWRSSP